MLLPMRMVTSQGRHQRKRPDEKILRTLPGLGAALAAEPQQAIRAKRRFTLVEDTGN